MKLLNLQLVLHNLLTQLLRVHEVDSLLAFVVQQLMQVDVDRVGLFELDLTHLKLHAAVAKQIVNAGVTLDNSKRHRLLLFDLAWLTLELRVMSTPILVVLGSLTVSDRLLDVHRQRVHLTDGLVDLLLRHNLDSVLQFVLVLPVVRQELVDVLDLAKRSEVSLVVLLKQLVVEEKLSICINDGFWVGLIEDLGEELLCVGVGVVEHKELLSYLLIAGKQS